MNRFPCRPRGGFFFATLALLGSLVTANAATLLPPGKQQFFDANGHPLAGGSVTFYIPGTTTNKTTWADSAQNTPNTNPVSLDITGSAVIYGSGCYRQIVKDSSANTIWDQPTCDTSSTSLIWAGRSSGTVNNQTVTASNFSGADGQSIAFIPAATNTGPFSLTVNGGSSLSVVRDTGTGPFAMTGGEIVANNIAIVQYDSTRGGFHLINNPAVGSSPVVSISGSGTVDLGATGSTNVLITGTATISSLGSSASTSKPYYNIVFGGASTLVEGVNLVLPGFANITTAAGDFALAEYFGAGQWGIKVYAKANATSIAPAPIVQQVGSCPWTVPGSTGGQLPSRVEFEAVGAGGGGGGNANDGATGGATTFNGITANGGAPGVHSANSFGVDGGIGGTGGGGTADLRVAGQPGAGSGSNEGGSGVGAAGVVAGSGGRAASSFSWAGQWSPSNSTARTNGGPGGGGAGFVSGVFGTGSSSGGGGGEYIRGVVTAPGATIACTIGAGGTAGTSAGTGGIGMILTRSVW